MSQSDLNFYMEVVLVTVLSLVAANAWTKWMNSSLNYFFPGDLKVDFIAAVITTIVAVFVLYFIFSGKRKTNLGHYKKVN